MKEIDASWEVGAYRREAERMDLDAESGMVLFLELSGQVALDECCLQNGPASVCGPRKAACLGRNGETKEKMFARRGVREALTLPVPPSPTNTNLKVGICCC